MTFGTYIRECRFALNLSLREASKRSGIPSDEWSKMERDVNTAPKDPTTKAALLKVLGLNGSSGTTYWILEGDSWTSHERVPTESDIDDHMPLFHLLTPKQKTKLRPLIRETLTRNPNSLRRPAKSLRKPRTKRAPSTDETLQKAVEAYYQSMIRGGYPVKEAAICTLGFVTKVLNSCLP